MAYQTNFPQGTDRPSQSVAQFQDNFTQLNTQFGIDHYPFVSPTNQGKHQKVTMPVQGADPATAASELAEYVKTLGAFSELYLRRDSNGTIIQMTSQDPEVGGGFPSYGQSFLPGGVQIKWGYLNVPAGGDNTATFTLLVPALTAFPNFGLIGFATAYNTSSQFNVKNVTQTSITIGSPGGGNCLWVALGA